MPAPTVCFTWWLSLGSSLIQFGLALSPGSAAGAEQDPSLPERLGPSSFWKGMDSIAVSKR